MGIMTMILTVANQIFLVNADYTDKALARIDNDNGASLAIRRIGELSRGATAVLASQTINGILYTTSTDTLVLKLPTVDAAGNVDTTNSDYIAIYRDTTVVTDVYTDIEAAAGSAKPNGKKRLTGNNTLLAFSYNDPVPYDATRVSVFLVNQKAVRGTTATSKEWTSIFLRNH